MGADDSAYTPAVQRAAEAGKALATANDSVSTSEERASTATRLRADSMDKLLARLDPGIRAQQQYETTISRINALQGAGIGSTDQYAQAMALAQQKFLDADNVITKFGNHFLELGRAARLFTLGYAIEEVIRFGRDVYQNFDAVEERARSLGIAVDTGLSNSIRESKGIWERSWTEMQLAVAPVVEAVAHLVELATLLPRGVAAAVSDMGRATTGAQFMARDTTNPGIVSAAAAPYVSNQDFAGTEALRQKRMQEQLADMAAQQQLDLQRANEQRAIDNANYAGTAELQQKILSEHQADNAAILESDKSLADQQLEIDNANFAATEAMRQKIMDENKAAADAIVNYQQQQEQWVRRFDDLVQHRIIEDIASIGDYMERARGKFGKAVEGMLLDITQLIVKLQITKALEASIGSGSGFSLGSLLGLGGSASSIASGAGVAPDVLITGSPAGFGGSWLGSLFSGWFADGGVIPPGKWGIAGENGPELIYGGAGGATVVPGRGAPSFYITQNINGSSDAALAAAVKEAHYAAVSTIKHNFPTMMMEAQQRNLP